MLALFDYQWTIPKHRGSCFSFHFPFLQLLIFRPTNLNPLRHRYLALESLMFISIKVLLFGGFLWIFRSSFSHFCSERHHENIFLVVKKFLKETKRAGFLRQVCTKGDFSGFLNSFWMDLPALTLLSLTVLARATLLKNTAWHPWGNSNCNNR